MARTGLSWQGIGPWRVDLWNESEYWHIEHEITGERERRGPWMWSGGVNYFDEAQAECQRRNALLKEV